MSLTTRFTETFGIESPIALAPMGGAAGGALAAAVSTGGGLGMVGGGRGDHDWLDQDLRLVAESTDKPWGIGFLAWAVDISTIEKVLEHRPAAIMFSFGDPAPFIQRVRRAGIPVLVQVTDLDEAKHALDLGADLLIAQGGEAGGHGRVGWSTMSFVPTVVDLAGSTPVLAAGGIADGRGVAAALVLGAAGALIGTRFQASLEARVPAEVVKALIDAGGGDTERSRITDILRGADWPPQYSARTVRTEDIDRWRGREDELVHDLDAQRAYRTAAQRGNSLVAPVWAGQSVDLVTDAPSAAELVGRLTIEAEQALTRVTTG
ncbi:NAD(P)H-dependent flavin oxidoreductase [Nocardia sp. NBC_01327]|uniref:NAD(P)H-dependent flavin oxidoreductase n=1 Tax=Nocardia sp. NBC_01327 TaxID=2903593 RepID=UPI002E162A24|nr:nitronate monooxygenase [Nocardia sp. NBC_01327]